MAFSCKVNTQNKASNSEPKSNLNNKYLKQKFLSRWFINFNIEQVSDFK